MSRAERVIKLIKRSDPDSLYRQLMPNSKECDFRDRASPEGRLEYPSDSREFKARVARLAMDIDAQRREMKTKLPGVYLAPCVARQGNEAA